MKDFSLSRSLKNDNSVELKLPLNKLRPMKIEVEDVHGIPMMYDNLNQIPGLKT